MTAVEPRGSSPTVAAPGDGGYFLHAQFLNFYHPITGEQINLETALPSGFSELSQMRGSERPKVENLVRP